MVAQKIKTLLIEDSGFMRILISDILRKDESIEVVATARNGKDGVEKTIALKPDVVITDMVMPDYDGLYVVRQLMKEMPVPIILLSSLNRANPLIFDALKEGAFDFLDKSLDRGTEYHALTLMIKEASMSDYLRLRNRFKGKNRAIHTFDTKLNSDIIAIGASTGGPGAIEYIINHFPVNLSIPVLIAQHMPERFIETYAVRLAETTGMKVSVIRDGESLLGGHIYLAPGNTNIRLDKSSGPIPVVRYTQDRFREYNYPSIDSIFGSIADIYGKRAVAVILTGMGKDGTEGLLKIQRSGGITISQDAASSVVYGMPKAAYESGAARYQIPLNEIPNFIISAL
jgi:two-component system chemotaxis response regulator CheB